LLASWKCRAGEAKNLSKIAFILAGDSVIIPGHSLHSTGCECPVTPGDAASSFGRVHQRLAGAREEREREEIMN